MPMTYYQENKDKVLEYQKNYYQENKDKVLQDVKNRYSKNRDSILEKRKIYHQNNKDSILEKRKIYHQNNKDKILESRKKYYQENRDKILEKRKANKDKRKQYYQNNKKQINEKCNDRHKKRYNSDPLYRLKHCIKAMFHRAIKVKKTEEILGCSYDEFMNYIETLWLPGMTWDNYCLDGWHIDHKTPLTWFDLSNPEEVAKANHYTNLQPMWAKDNYSKGNRWSE